jgi:hypothetical protein
MEVVVEGCGASVIYGKTMNMVEIVVSLQQAQPCASIASNRPVGRFRDRCCRR